MLQMKVKISNQLGETMATTTRILLAAVVVLATAAWAQDSGGPAGAPPQVAPAGGEVGAPPPAAPGGAATAGAAPAVEAAPAVTPDAAPQSAFEVLAAEVRRLKEELALPEPTYQSYSGLGPAASKVYFTPKGLSIGGYGEAFYALKPAPEGQSSTDMLRAVLYVGYRFSDRIVFNSEIEFEHGQTSRGGVVGVEFAYLDFKLHDYATLRAGNVLVPMGFVNEIHEPPFFFGVQRPFVERNLIPSTWNENGVGLYGETKGLRYRGYLVNGMRAVGAGRFSASSWARGGRQGGALAVAENLAGVGAVDYSIDPVRVGVSAYYGRAGQGEKVGGAVVLGELFLGEAHAAVQHKGFSARGLIVYGRLGDAGLISSGNGSVVGQEVLGGYAELAFDVLSAVDPGSDSSLSPFVRYESFDTQKSVADGFARDFANARQVVTAGLHYKPLPNVVVKADYQHVLPGRGRDDSTLSLGVGFVF